MWISDRQEVGASLTVLLICEKIAFGSGGLLFATFFGIFFRKQNVTLARKLTEARKHQRRDAASETRRALSGTAVFSGNYARRHMDVVLAALPSAWPAAAGAFATGNVLLTRVGGVWGVVSLFWADARGAARVFVFCACRQLTWFYTGRTTPSRQTAATGPGARRGAIFFDIKFMSQSDNNCYLVNWERAALLTHLSSAAH